MGALRLNLGVVGDGDVGVAAAVVEAAVGGVVLGVDGDRILFLILDCGVFGGRCFTTATLRLLTIVLLRVGYWWYCYRQLVLLMLLLLPLGMDVFTPTEVMLSMRTKREVECGQSRVNSIRQFQAVQSNGVATRTNDAEKWEAFIVVVGVITSIHPSEAVVDSSCCRKLFENAS
jgi:hypothetical protein